MERVLDWDAASEQVGELSGQVAQLHAQMIQVAAGVIKEEAWAVPGIRSVEHFLELKTGLDRHTVTKIAKVARRISDLPELMESLHQGRVTLDQAAVVAQHTPASHSGDVADFAQYVTVSQLRRGLSGYFHQTSPDSAPQEKHSETQMQMTMTNDRFRLSFNTSDLAAGALVENAIREAKDALFTQGNTEATLADGLVEAANRSLGTVTEPARINRYQVLVHLDTEDSSWLHKAGALPSHIAKRYTCEGQLIPVWKSQGKPVAVGRTQRIVPDRVRRLIEDRDKGCRFPGCHSSGHLEIHHQQHWRDGGVTDPSNLLSLCNYHHDEHHRGGFAIHGDPERIDGLIFRSHHGISIDAERAAPPPVDKLPPSQWQDNLGEKLETKWLSFKSNPTPMPGLNTAAQPDVTELRRTLTSESQVMESGGQTKLRPVFCT